MSSKRELLSKFGTAESRSNDEARTYCDLRFRQLRGFQFTRSTETLLRSSGPVFHEWRVSVVRSTGHQVTIDEESFALLVPYIGTISVSRGSRTSIAKPGSCIVVGGGERTTLLSEGYIGSIIQFPVKAAHTLVAEAKIGDSRRDHFCRLETLSSPELTFECRALVDGLDRRGATWWAVDGPRADFRSRVCNLISMLDEVSGQGGAMHAQASIQHVHRAEEYMRARLNEDITMTHVAREAGISLRSLQLAFRRHRGCTPKVVLKTLRLAEARKRLTDPSHNTSIASVATDLGFYNFGRFAQAYRQLFGELPSQTRQ